MNIKQLQKILESEKIKREACLINNKLSIEGALTLRLLKDGTWSITLNERGEYLINEIFQTESDACKAYITHVFSDPTYFEGFKQSDLKNWHNKKAHLFKKYEIKE